MCIEEFEKARFRSWKRAFLFEVCLSGDACYGVHGDDRSLVLIIRSRVVFHRNYRSNLLCDYSRSRFRRRGCGARFWYSLLRYKLRPRRRNRHSSRKNDHTRNTPHRRGCDILFPCNPPRYIASKFLLRNLTDCGVHELIQEQPIIRQVKHLQLRR